MKSWLWNGMLAAAIALPALSGMARAQDNDGCSNATLHGDYAFAVTGWILSPGQLWVPEFIVGIINVRGELLAIFDLQRLFGMPSRGLTDRSWAIVFGETVEQI